MASEDACSCDTLGLTVARDFCQKLLLPIGFLGSFLKAKDKTPLVISLGKNKTGNKTQCSIFINPQCEGLWWQVPLRKKHHDVLDFCMLCGGY